ncbi:MAG: hypothetical protein LBQ28_10790 [Prevotellaceae bacterium]|nr:hypothetical protein [Prevotellaceae bacterium]
MKIEFKKNPLATAGSAAVVVGVIIFLFGYFVFFSNLEMQQSASEGTRNLFQTVDWFGAGIYWIGLVLAGIGVFSQPKQVAVIALVVALCNQVWVLFNSVRTLINVPSEYQGWRFWFFFVLNMLIFGGAIFLLIRNKNVLQKSEGNDAVTANIIKQTDNQTAKKRNWCGIIGFLCGVIASILLSVFILEPYAILFYMGEWVKIFLYSIPAFSVLGFILSIIGLFKKLKGFAIAGTVLCLAVSLICLVLILTEGKMI